MLKVDDLSKKFKEGFSLDKISFHLEPGYIMGFIGPNGSGKTTTIKLIMNLLKKDGGDISIFGMDHIKQEREVKDRIGFVYDESHFYEDLTMKQMKDIIAPFYSKWQPEVYVKYMKDFDLDQNMKIKKLSKGMKMKYSLALALSHDAELIIMDEPTSGLDPIFRREILDILSGIIQNGDKSIFFSTHITTDLEHIADYITFINNGKLVFSDTKDEIMEGYRLVKGDSKRLDADLRKSFIGIRETKVGFAGLTKQHEMFEGLGEDFMIDRPTLEDIMYYTGKGE